MYLDIKDIYRLWSSYLSGPLSYDLTHLIAWTDREIHRLSEPPKSLIELSLAKKGKEAHQILQDSQNAFWNPYGNNQATGNEELIETFNAIMEVTAKICRSDSILNIARASCAPDKYIEKYSAGGGRAYELPRHEWERQQILSDSTLDLFEELVNFHEEVRLHDYGYLDELNGHDKASSTMNITTVCHDKSNLAEQIISITEEIIHHKYYLSDPHSGLERLIHTLNILKTSQNYESRKLSLRRRAERDISQYFWRLQIA